VHYINNYILILIYCLTIVSDGTVQQVKRPVPTKKDDDSDDSDDEKMKDSSSKATASSQESMQQLAALNMQKLATQQLRIYQLENGNFVILSHQAQVEKYNDILVMVWSPDFTSLLFTTNVQRAEEALQVEYIKNMYLAIVFPSALMEVPILNSKATLALKMKQKEITSEYLADAGTDLQVVTSVLIEAKDMLQIDGAWTKAAEAAQKQSNDWLQQFKGIDKLKDADLHALINTVCI